jgi:hypothetical protein
MFSTIWQPAPRPQSGILRTIENRGLTFLLVVGVGLLLILGTFASFFL